MKNLYVLVGPPGSGKSTWIESQFHDGCFIVSTDNIIQDIAESEGKTYDEVFSTHIKTADQIMWKGFESLVEGGYSPIVIDRTNMSAKSRAKFIETVKGSDYKLHAVVFPKPEDAEYERRLGNRPGKSIPKNVITSMLANFQMPTLDEGFETITIIED